VRIPRPLRLIGMAVVACTAQDRFYIGRCGDILRNWRIGFRNWNKLDREKHERRHNRDRDEAAHREEWAES
jgi:hypothetical protein